MILSMTSYRASLSQFLADRKLALEEMAQGKPWFLLAATPIYVDNDKVDPLRRDIRAVLEKAPGNPDSDSFPLGIGADKPAPRLFGIEAEAKLGFTDAPYVRYLRLFRNGHFECCSDTIRRGVRDGFPTTPMTIYAYEMAVLILHFLEVARRLMVVAEINEPIALTVHLQNCNPSVLRYWSYDHDQDFILSSGQAIVCGNQSLSLDMSDTDLTNPEYLARSLMDRLFTAFGTEPVHNKYFDAEGHFVKQK